MSLAYAMHPEVCEQSGNEDCFLGGRPKLPPDLRIPTCSLCAHPQTFFFQLAFPDDHAWHGFTVATFACTNWADERFLIPEMLPGTLRAADVPTAFVSSYQRNFAFMVFPTASSRMMPGYIERVRFCLIHVEPGDELSFGRIGGTPQWVLEDETPGTIGSVGAVFLLQLGPRLRFETVRGAPRQIELRMDGRAAPAGVTHYELFIGNMTYYFGPKLPAPESVYALTQVD